MPATTLARFIERERKEPMRSILRRAADQRMSPEEIADDLGVSVQTVKNYLRPLGGRFIRTIWVPDLTDGSDQ
jgi:predicted transcriptional regulator